MYFDDFNTAQEDRKSVVLFPHWMGRWCRNDGQMHWYSSIKMLFYCSTGDAKGINCTAATSTIGGRNVHSGKRPFFLTEFRLSRPTPQLSILMYKSTRNLPLHNHGQNTMDKVENFASVYEFTVTESSGKINSLRR